MFAKRFYFWASGKNLQSRAKNPIIHIKAIKLDYEDQVIICS